MSRKASARLFFNVIADDESTDATSYFILRGSCRDDNNFFGQGGAADVRNQKVTTTSKDIFEAVSAAVRDMKPF